MLIRTLVYKDKVIFHITHIGNLPTILKTGILCKNIIKSKNLKYKDISSDTIQKARSAIPIPNTSYTLHDYVPAFFGARPPMLYAVIAKGIAQEEIIYILIKWNIIDKNTTWFTDGNARGRDTKFYQGIANLNKVDFEAAGADYWGGKGDDYKRKKQAEVLILQSVLLDDIVGFVVYNKDAKDRAQKMVDAQNVKSRIFIEPKFYY